MPNIHSFIFAICLGANAHSAQENKGGEAAMNTRLPAYSVLDRFLGTWDAQVEVESADGKKSMQSLRNTFAWDLNGRFLKDEGKNSEGSATFLGLWSYNAQAKRYHSWYFQGPGGEVSQMTYAWDEKNQTLTGAGEPGGGMTVEAVDRFIDKDHYDWSIVVKDKDGRMLNRMKAHSTRAAKP